ncbi:hypothetical protein ABID21_001686 [Pseudorhizobium tarimense]|uniref:Uncharacterized protein n=1 Tax=Pseudorhizobium tarimense TaxID=1079109 RepID=A0ABV2H5Q2_9HYPH
MKGGNAEGLGDCTERSRRLYSSTISSPEPVLQAELFLGMQEALCQ